MFSEENREKLKKGGFTKEVKLLLLGYILLIRSRADPPVDSLPANIEIAAKVTRMNSRHVKDKAIDHYLSKAMKAEFSHSAHLQYMSQSTRDQQMGCKEGKEELPGTPSHSSHRYVKGSLTPNKKYDSFALEQADNTRKSNVDKINNNTKVNNSTFKFDYLFIEDRTKSSKGTPYNKVPRLSFDGRQSKTPKGATFFKKEG